MNGALYNIIVNEAFCKGCGICSEFCAKQVLTMENQVAKVVNLGGCNGCRLCENRCPDMALEVTPK